MQEIFRLENLAVGVYDDKNFYIAQVSVGGKGAKDEGQDRFANLKYFPTLEHACRRMPKMLTNSKNIKTVEQYCKDLETAAKRVAAIFDEVTNKPKKGGKK